MKPTRLYFKIPKLHFKAVVTSCCISFKETKLIGSVKSKDKFII